MSYPYPAENEAFKFLQITANTVVKTGPGVLGGIFVSSASGATIIVYDSTVTTGVGTLMVDTFTPSAAVNYPFPALFTTGLAFIINGTASITVFYQ